jgi:nucleotidyltransferase/DNA polymerase involved in DNA repair
MKVLILQLFDRLGLDEGAVDITAEVKAWAGSGMKAQIFSGHVIGSSSQLSRSLEGITSSDCAGSEDLKCLDQMGFAGTQGDNLVMLGSQIVSEIRTAVERETGFQMSCGLAHNVSSNLPLKSLHGYLSGFQIRPAIRLL